MADLLSTGISTGETGYYSEKKEAISVFIQSILRFLFSGMILTLFFLGSLHAKFGYPSSMKADLDKGMLAVSQSFFNLYQVGYNNPNHFFYVTIIAMSVFFVWIIWDLIDLIILLRKK